MTRDCANNLIGNFVQLEDEVYYGNKHKHNWKCECGNIFKRTFDNMRNTNANCGCKKDKYAKKYGWKSIRIPYWEFDNVEKILNKEIKS